MAPASLAWRAVGAEPTAVRHRTYKGIHLFKAEEEDVVELMRVLTPAQRRQSIVGASLQIELFTGHFRDNLQMDLAGARSQQVSETQRQRTIKLLRAWVDYISSPSSMMSSCKLRRHASAGQTPATCPA